MPRRLSGECLDAGKQIVFFLFEMAAISDFAPEWKRRFAKPSDLGAILCLGGRLSGECWHCGFPCLLSFRQAFESSTAPYSSQRIACREHAALASDELPISVRSLPRCTLGRRSPQCGSVGQRNVDTPDACIGFRHSLHGISCRFLQLRAIFRQ